MRALSILGKNVRVVHPAEGGFDLSGCDSVLDAVVRIITRHPMREDELRSTLEPWSPKEVEQALQTLSASGQAQIVERYGVRFWSASPARYANRR